MPTKKSRKLSNRPSPSFAGLQRTATVEFNPDYTNVKKDLTRIAVLAVSFFVILIALSFFLR